MLACQCIHDKSRVQYRNVMCLVVGNISECYCVSTYMTLHASDTEM